MTAKLTLAASDGARPQSETPAPNTPPKSTLSLDDLRTLDARELDERLHRMGLSRQASKRVTHLVKAAERAAPGAPATCADGRVTIVLNACGKACPNAHRG